MSEYKVHGIGCELEVFEDKLTLTPKGLRGLLNKGFKGTKTIPFTSITAVQHKRAGFTSGYLQFTLPEGIDSRSGLFEAGSDENSILFSGDVDNALIEKIKDYIERRRRELRSPTLPSSGNNVADQLAKLAKLREQGVLSDAEFAAAKQRVLRSG